MKKQIAVAASMLAGALCISLAGCGGEKTPVNEDWVNFISEQVSAQEWERIFAEDNFTNVRMDKYWTVSMVRSGQPLSGTAEETFIIVDDLAYFKRVVSGDEELIGDFWGNENYYNRVEDDGNGGSEVILYIQDEEGDWIKYPEEIDYYSTIDFYFFASVFGFAKNDSVYSTEKKGYVIEIDEGYETGEVIVKFKDGKLAWMDVSTKSDSSESEAQMVFTFGGQSLTLPTIKEK